MDTYPYDFTIFAWGNLASKCSREINDVDTILGLRPLELESFDSRDDYLLGLLAESPRDYASSGQIVPSPDSQAFLGHESPIQQRNKNTVSLNLAVEPRVRSIAFRHPLLGSLHLKNMRYAILPCGRGRNPLHYVAIPLVIPHRTAAVSGRMREMIITTSFTNDEYSCYSLRYFKKMLTVAPLARYRPPETGDIIFRRR